MVVGFFFISTNENRRAILILYEKYVDEMWWTLGIRFMVLWFELVNCLKTGNDNYRKPSNWNDSPNKSVKHCKIG